MAVVDQVSTSAAIDLTTELAGLRMPNPVMTASGCAAAGRELDQFFDVAHLGAVVTKSIMRDPRSGRPTPRMAETASGMLNSIGLQGPGIGSFLATDLPWLVARGARAVVSIAGGTTEEFVELARRVVASPGVAALEVNISCPNVDNRGLVFACDPTSAAQVIAAVRAVVPVGLPLLAKLTPDVTDIVAVAASVVDAGADALVMINTLLGLRIDPETLRPQLGGVTGGLSGPAVRPVAVRCVWQVHRALPGVPLVGVGGIRTGADALEFLAAGATAVQVGTAIFNDPSAPMRIVHELAAELDRRGIPSPADVVGVAHR
jgi:dihydroorotate dehydrogenase (NAD+) catalytic subunit